MIAKVITHRNERNLCKLKIRVTTGILLESKALIGILGALVDEIVFTNRYTRKSKGAKKTKVEKNIGSWSSC